MSSTQENVYRSMLGTVIGLVGIFVVAGVVSACRGEVQGRDTSSQPNPASEESASADADAGVAEADEAVAQPTSKLLELFEPEAVLGDVVAWRTLGQSLPSELGGFSANGELQGETTRLSRTSLTEVSRGYRHDDEVAYVTITDTAKAPLLRAPFFVERMVEEDSSHGFHREADIVGNPAYVDWSEPESISSARALIGGRYLVWVEVEHAQNSEEARQLLTQLDLSHLAGLSAECNEPGGCPSVATE